MRRFVSGLGHERTVAVAVAAIVLGASFLSVAPGRPGGANGGTGGPTGDGPEARLAVGGSWRRRSVGNVEADYAVDEPVAAYVEPAPNVNALSRIEGVDVADPEAQAAITAQAELKTAVEGPFLDDGTLLKPVAVDTSVADGSRLMRTYKVKAGDTLARIAYRFDVSTMTLWWANKLKSKDRLVQGQELRIPPVSGLVVTVKATDTLDGLARKYKVAEDEIVVTNGLEDPNLVVGPGPDAAGRQGRPDRAAEAAQGDADQDQRRWRLAQQRRRRRWRSAEPPDRTSGGNFAWPTSSRSRQPVLPLRPLRPRHRGSHGRPGLRRGRRHGDLGRLEEQRRRLPGLDRHGAGLYTTYNHMSKVSSGAARTSRGSRRPHGRQRLRDRSPPPLRAVARRRSGAAARASTH